jgi:hypothetical protein
MKSSVEPAKLFIVGAPRSGTTLVRDLVDCSPDVSLLVEELQILPQLIAMASKGCGWEQMEKVLAGSAHGTLRRAAGTWPAKSVFERELGASTGSRLLDKLLVLLAQRGDSAQVRYVGEKTPENIAHLDAITRQWPDARLLFVARDPRATVNSMHRSWGRSIVRAADIWRRSAGEWRRWSERRGPSLCHMVRYEDLLRDPRGELSKIFGWLGVEPEFSGVTSYARADEWSSERQYEGVASVESNWRDQLSMSDLGRIEEICYDEMLKLGYIPNVANRSVEPGILELRTAMLFDAVRILGRYARSKGLLGALAYKARQWRMRHAVRAD